MVASSGRLLVPQAWRAIRFAVERTSRAIRERLPQSSKALQAELQPAYARNVAARQPIHRAAAIRQSQSRWYTTRRTLSSTFRQFSSEAAQGAKATRASFPTSRTATAVSHITSRTPFASTLRPNLTGGTLSRSAGGYGTGAGRVGGVRHFSHSPAAPAEVINNVSAAMRAFWLSGQRLQYDGANPHTGAMRYKSVSQPQQKAARKLESIRAPGSFVDFKVAPIITAVSPLCNNPADSKAQSTLNDEGLLDALSGDFARALKDFSIVTSDLKKLETVGDLSLSHPEPSVLRVRFPGCDAVTLESLCDELGIQRGTVHEDPDFDAYHGAELALLFPFAPSGAATRVSLPSAPPQTCGTREEVTWQEMLSPEISLSPGFSHISATSNDLDNVHLDVNPWLASPSGYSSFPGSSELDANELFEVSARKVQPAQSEYDGIQGIYRFLEECDRAKR